MTIGEKYNPVMEIQTQEEAKQAFEKCVEHTMGQGYTREDAITIEKANIRYFSGYFEPETRTKILKLLNF
jgi:hypothetical protein